MQRQAEVSHSHGHTGTVSTSRHSWVKRSSIEKPGESLSSSESNHHQSKWGKSLRTAQYNVFGLLQWQHVCYLTQYVGGIFKSQDLFTGEMVHKLEDNATELSFMVWYKSQRKQILFCLSRERTNIQYAQKIYSTLKGRGSTVLHEVSVFSAL